MASDHNEVAARGPEAQPDRDRERRLFEILADYFAAVEAGRAPDRAEWLARYPAWTEEIAAFLDEQDRLLKLTEPFRPTTGEDPASDPESAFGGTWAGPSTGHHPTDGSAGDPPGTRVRYIGDYELLGEIARGGMGVVFRARQRSLNRPVALKMLLAEDYATEADEQRFRLEAEAAANLDHPHIVPIFEVGRHDGRSYFSMKLVEGGSLSRRLSEFASDLRAAARLVAIVARAVHHAHRRGVLHRDLKPGNILLGGGPETPLGELDPLVTDFGLAKRVEDDPELTQSGAILGTASYMAPEQANGKRGSVTVATDVHGLGSLLYAMLSGRPPFRGDTLMETIAQVKDGAVDPPGRRGRRVDRDLETICLKCLEKEPGRRYHSAEAVAEELERWLAGLPILARPTGHIERASRWCRRHSMAVALAATACLLVAAAAAGLWVVWQTHRAARRDAYARDLRLAGELLKQNRPAEAARLLLDHRSAPGEDGASGFAWRYLWRLAHVGGPPLLGHTEEVYHAEFSPDGRTLATASKDSTVRLWDVATRRIRLVLGGEDGHSHDVNWVTYSPDGKLLATASEDQTVKLWDPESGQLLRTLQGHGDEVVGVVFSSDGRQLVSVARHSKVIIWDPVTAVQSKSFTVSNGTPQSLAVSPDGAVLAIAGDQVAIWDLARAREVCRLGNPGQLFDGVAFSHDGKYLGAAGRYHYVNLWTTRDWQPGPALQGRHGAHVEALAFAPDDRTTASVDDFGIIHLWEIASGACDTIATGQERLWGVAFSPDGRTLATTSQDASVKLWDPRHDGLRISHPIPSAKEFRPSLAFSSDGKTLVVADRAGTVWSFDASRGVPIGTARIRSKAPIVATALSPDAGRVATAERDGALAIWDRDGAHCLARSKVAFEPTRHLAASLNARYVAVAGDGGPLVVWDTSTGSPRQFTTDRVELMQFSPDGTCLAVTNLGDPGHPALWDVRTGRSVRADESVHRGNIGALAFSADGRTLATGGSDMVSFWDGRSLKMLGHLSGQCTPLAFSPDGRTLASSGDTTVRLFDIAARREIVTLNSHSLSVGNLLFSPDGRMLASWGGYVYSSLIPEVFLWPAAPAE